VIAAAAMSVLVSMGAGSFSPAHLDVLPGDNVVWRNNSTKTHNVKFDTEGFNSGRVPPRSGSNHVFSVAGVYAYHCTIHDGMVGEVGVYPLVLEGPRGRVRRGTTIAFHVRTPEDAGEVTIEANAGAGYHPVATAGPAEGGAHDGHEEPGTVHANVVASETATYRAVYSGGSSNELAVEVTDAPDLSARARKSRRGTVVTVSANPVTPGARIVLEVNLRERFGWWPARRARLDRRGRASILVHGYGRARARAVLVGRDWATPLNETRTFRLRG
jgi:Copper binding proteins, plastocyanin/azurin family